ncbi:UNVERIFIED_CONTAM: hypothetical protein GTU68_038698 [Idotea baltica]|nr:hypothetical protein [Idotea baltica]
MHHLTILLLRLPIVRAMHCHGLHLVDKVLKVHVRVRHLQHKLPQKLLVNQHKRTV